MNAATAWRVARARTLRWTACDPLVMAIVNVTPDSFSDGGSHNDFEGACAYAHACTAAGADILDVGGESTRPGAAAVSCEEQIARTRAVIERIARTHPTAVISIDTTRAAVARAALDAGASVVNDVSAGSDDAAMWQLVAERECGYVLMHRLRTPSDDSYSDRYAHDPQYGVDGDVVSHVGAWLRDCAQRAERAGIAREAIAVDPGLGFGKSVAQNFALIARMHEIVALGYPVVVSASRKSFLGAATSEVVPARRDGASIAVALELAGTGVAVIRAHDVAGHVAGLRSKAENAQKTR